MSRAAFDHYPTPRPFVWWLLDELAADGVHLGETMFAPCHGSGAIAAAIASWPAAHQRPSRVLTNDLDPRWQCDTALDASKREAWVDRPRYTSVIDNPPFLKAIEIIEHAVSLAPVVAMHVRCTLNEPTKKHKTHAELLRRRFLRDHPPTGTLWLPRFRYAKNAKGDWSNDSATCVWLVWLRGVSGQFVRYAPDWVIDEAQALDRARGSGGGEEGGSGGAGDSSESSVVL